MASSADETARRWTRADIERARVAVDTLLGEAGLDAYLFGVEPLGDDWEVRVELAVDGGWKTTRLRVGEQALLDSVHDPAVRRRILDGWAAKLCC